MIFLFIAWAIGVLTGFAVFSFVFRHEKKIREVVEHFVLEKKRGSILEPGNEELENFIKSLPKE